MVVGTGTIVVVKVTVGTQVVTAMVETLMGALELGAGAELGGGTTMVLLETAAGLLVDTATGVEVAITPELAGQLVTVGAHEVMVTWSVEVTVWTSPLGRAAARPAKMATEAAVKRILNVILIISTGKKPSR